MSDVGQTFSLPVPLHLILPTADQTDRPPKTLLHHNATDANKCIG